MGRLCPGSVHRLWEEGVVQDSRLGSWGMDFVGQLCHGLVAAIKRHASSSTQAIMCTYTKHILTDACHIFVTWQDGQPSLWGWIHSGMCLIHRTWNWDITDHIAAMNNIIQLAMKQNCVIRRSRDAQGPKNSPNSTRLSFFVSTGRIWNLEIWFLAQLQKKLAGVTLRWSEQLQTTDWSDSILLSDKHPIAC